MNNRREKSKKEMFSSPKVVGPRPSAYSFQKWLDYMVVTRQVGKASEGNLIFCVLKMLLLPAKRRRNVRIVIVFCHKSYWMWISLEYDHSESLLSPYSDRSLAGPLSMLVPLSIMLWCNYIIRKINIKLIFLWIMCIMVHSSYQHGHYGIVLLGFCYNEE